MQSNNNESYDILSDDEDDNEARLSCSLRWLINKAYSNGSIPDYLPNEHFFQNENNERFLSPDIALVLLSGDLYIRAFQYITNQQDQLITYDDIINYFYLQNIHFDINLLKQDEPLNANIHLELIDNLMKLYFNIILDQNILYQRFNKLQLKSILTLLNKTKQLNTESFLIIWINGICEYMSNQLSQRIPPIIDLRTSLIDGTCLFTLISYYDKNYNNNKKIKNDLNFLRNYLNHYNGNKMTNIFPFTIKHLRENIIPDLNIYGMLIDIFVLYEIEENIDKKNFSLNSNDNEDEENIYINKSNQTYSLDEDDDDVDDDDNNNNIEDGTNEFFILNDNHHNNEQITTGGILQTSTNHDRQMVAPIKSSLKTSISSSTNTNASPKKTTFMSTTTTWQRQALSNQTTPINTIRNNHETISIDDHQLTNEYLAVKMQLEMKKRSIERDKQRLETIRDNKRQTISQEAFKQLLQQKTRHTSALTNEFLPSTQSNNTHIRKSQTTSEFRSQSNKTSIPQQQTILIEPKKDESSIVDLSKPMTRDEFLNTLELLKQKYIETTTTASPNIIEENRIDEGHRIEQLNSNIGELQQVITSLSAKQEEIHNQVVNANGSNVSRNATFSRKSMTYPRRILSSTPREQQQQEEESPKIEKSLKANGLILEIVDNPSASTAIEMERKRELVLQRQQQRQEAYERRRQMREMENLKRDDEQRKKDNESSTKKLEREQRRDEIFRQYLMKKEKNISNTNDHTNDEHPIIKMRPKSSTSTIIQKPPIEKRQTGPIVISPFGTRIDSISSTDVFNNNTDTNETITTPALSFVRMAELRANKTYSSSTKIDSRTLPRSSARSTIEPPLPLIPLNEPRYPLAKPLSGKSNKQTIINALTQVILAGRVNDRIREQVCDEIERNIDKIKHFIILFRDSRLQFRGIYTFIPTVTSDSPIRIERLYGQGPREITETMVENFYKYNNGSKQFSQVPIKSFSVQCDAITILNNYWTQQSAATKRTTTTTAAAAALPTNPSD